MGLQDNTYITVRGKRKTKRKQMETSGWNRRKYKTENVKLRSLHLTTQKSWFSTVIVPIKFIQFMISKINSFYTFIIQLSIYLSFCCHSTLTAG